MQLIARSYETQVKTFMLMVVLFLVSANLITVTFLSRSEDLLQEEARARAVAATVSMSNEVESEGLVAPVLKQEPGAGARATERLARFCVSQGASVAEIVDMAGRVIASSQPWRVGGVDPPASILDPAEAAALAAGRSALARGEQEGDLTTAFVPLSERAESGRLYLRAGYILAAARTIANQIRVLTWAQGLGGLVVLAMVILFTRFVLAPYRALKETAAGLRPAESPGGAGDDPAFLVASFRGVVDKMRSLEGELERMKFGGSSPGAQESFLSSLSSGVLILETSGAVAALNPAGAAILGLRPGEAAGRSVQDLFASSPELLSLLEDALRHGRGKTREVVSHRLPTGRSVHLGVTVSSPPGGGAGALCLFSDLTEIRGLQERVLLKENLARVGELSAGIAHEFRNSLATILGYARLSTKPENDPSGNALAIIREVQSMGRVVDDFLRYAAPARLQRAEFDLRSMLQEVGREAVRPGEEDVSVVLEGEWPERILGDEGLLKQALNNLVRNAVEAALAGTGARRVTLKGRRDGGASVIEISDTGPGFPEAVLSRPFTPFVTTKERGTGLGMALAQKIVVSHDGAIDAVNLPGGGARVTVVVPVG